MKRFLGIFSLWLSSFIAPSGARRAPLRPFYLLMFLFFLAALVLYWQIPAQATTYKYVDRNGNVHFTDRLESIPEEYRGQVKVYPEEVKPEISPPPAREESRDSAAKLGEEEKKKKELEEKAAQEEKIKAREAKEKRISELRAQIRAKQEEQRSLRTTWMVYDRTKLNQLNAEIAALEKQVESLQKEIPEQK